MPSQLANRLRLACACPVVVELRQQDEDDRVFLRQLFVSRRWDETCAMPGWDDQQRLAFLHQQADLQQRHYAQHHPDAAFLIVERQGQAIGRFCVSACGSALRLVDVALLPDWQGLGIGSSLLRAVITVAEHCTSPVELTVDAQSPARRLYQRHGFMALTEQGLSLQMRRPAGQHEEPAPMTG